MSCQLILCVETNKKTQSDYIYIKETIEKFYDLSEIKITPVYMDGKLNMIKKEMKLKNTKRCIAVALRKIKHMLFIFLTVMIMI